MKSSGDSGSPRSAALSSMLISVRLILCARCNSRFRLNRSHADPVESWEWDLNRARVPGFARRNSSCWSNPSTFASFAIVFSDGRRWPVSKCPTNGMDTRIRRASSSCVRFSRRQRSRISLPNWLARGLSVGCFPSPLDVIVPDHVCSLTENIYHEHGFSRIAG